VKFVIDTIVIRGYHRNAQSSATATGKTTREARLRGEVEGSQRLRVLLAEDWLVLLGTDAELVGVAPDRSLCVDAGGLRVGLRLDSEIGVDWPGRERQD
jgi:hypothetical protein